MMMADFDVSVKTTGRARRSTKVDLTAMVDLGFLLITFFMLATNLAEPRTMEVFKPEEAKDNQSLYPKSKTMTLLLGDNDKVYYYTAIDDTRNIGDVYIDSVDYSPQGLRKAIANRKNELINKYGEEHRDDLLVFIKPLPSSTLKNTIDVFDELQINDIKRIALVNPTEVIDSLIAYEVGQGF